jgi:bacterioferritin
MKHADQLVERILYLEGVPNLQKLRKVNVGQTVREQLRLDLEVEKAAVKALNGGIETVRSLGDNGTRELLESRLEGEEEHANWLEAQLTLIEQVGEGTISRSRSNRTTERGAAAQRATVKENWPSVTWLSTDTTRHTTR